MLTRFTLMSHELLPPIDLPPPIPQRRLPEQCIRMWIDLNNACEQFLLAGLRARSARTGILEPPTAVGMRNRWTSMTGPCGTWSRNSIDAEVAMPAGGVLVALRETWLRAQTAGKAHGRDGWAGAGRMEMRACDADVDLLLGVSAQILPRSCAAGSG